MSLFRPVLVTDIEFLLLLGFMAICAVFMFGVGVVTCLAIGAMT